MRLHLVLAATLFAFTLAAHADTLAGTTAGTTNTNGSNGSFDLGQSFTVSGTGSYTDITFNFYTGSTPYAVGTGYLFSEPYTGTPADLSSSDAGYLGMATASGGLYSFGSSVVLTAGDQYFFYEDTTVGTLSGGATIVGGEYFISEGGSPFVSDPTGQSFNFDVTGTESTSMTSVTPEPSSILLLGTGLLGILGTMRKRFA